jgi:hypothetical protein
MFASGIDVGDHTAVKSLPEVVEKSGSTSVQELDVSGDEKKASNVEILETSDSPAESIVSPPQRTAQ